MSQQGRTNHSILDTIIDILFLMLCEFHEPIKNLCAIGFLQGGVSQTGD